VDRERPLYSHPERLLANGECLPSAGALTLDHDPFENLGSPPLALDHLKMDPHAIARIKPRHLPQLASLDALDDCAHLWEALGRPRDRLAAD
jgi:hypothetical protein